MRRSLISMLLLAALLLSACSPAATPAAVATATPPPQPSATAPAVIPTTAAAPASGEAMTCTLQTSLPDPVDAARFPAVTENDWILGAADASITLLEYSDFQCPYCAMLAPVLEQIVQQNPDIRVVFRHFPLPSHDKSLLAAQAMEAAGAQGKFFELHNLVFETQGEWIEKPEAEFRSWLLEQATRLGLDRARFTADMDSPAVAQKVKQAQTDGEKAQIGGTPYLMINGIEYPGQLPRDYETIMTVVKLVQLSTLQYTSCPPVVIDAARQYTATLKTDQGDIVVQLFPDKAPTAVNSFVFLAREGWFNGVTFHRVLKGFVAQTGDPTGTGYGGPGYVYSNEISDLKFDKEGLLAMANSGPESNGSQFFITLAAQPDLNGGYTIFGQVLEGMDVVNRLTERDPQSATGLPPGDRINAVTITEK